MIQMPIRILIVILLLILSLPVMAKEKDVDYLSLAAILIKDGHYDRAEAALMKLEIAQEANKAQGNDEEVIEDKARFYTLKGLVQLKKQDFVNAKASFQSAIQAGQTELVVYVYLAQAAYGDKDYRTTLDAIANAGEQAKSVKGLYTIKAQSHWKLDEKNSAWNALQAGLDQFPDEAVFLRQQIFFLLELKLYQDAIVIGNKYLSRAEAVVEDYLAIGSSLRKSHEAEKSISILEKAKLIYPDDTRVVVELAHAYLDSDKVVVAAELFQHVASLDTEYMSEAAELFRRAGKLGRALNLNAQVRDKAKKLKQRLAILLEYEDFELAAAMDKPLNRIGLLEDEDIRYATAYSLFKAGQFDEASEQLSFIKRPDLFRKSTELRKVMQNCESAAWSCY